MKIVLGGSRKLEFIPDPVVSFLNNSIERGDYFLIGDATGVDSTIQKFMLMRKYQNVEIFSSAGNVRNNLGKWKEHQIKTNLKSKSNALHAFKDREMCERADLGLMIWDQESAGTLSNAIDLLSQGKSCYIYNALEQEFFKFDSSRTLDKWLETYPEVAAEALSRLNRFRKRLKIGSNLDSVQPGLF